jgi:hypothetical protein
MEGGGGGGTCCAYYGCFSFPFPSHIPPIPHTCVLVPISSQEYVYDEDAMCYDVSHVNNLFYYLGITKHPGAGQKTPKTARGTPNREEKVRGGGAKDVVAEKLMDFLRGEFKKVRPRGQFTSADTRAVFKAARAAKVGSIAQIQVMYSWLNSARLWICTFFFLCLCPFCCCGVVVLLDCERSRRFVVS